eukprot:7056404-Lingulodinium_polyedra.AAC.1
MRILRHGGNEPCASVRASLRAASRATLQRCRIAGLRISRLRVVGRCSPCSCWFGRDVPVAAF